MDVGEAVGSVLGVLFLVMILISFGELTWEEVENFGMGVAIFLGVSMPISAAALKVDSLMKRLLRRR